MWESYTAAIPPTQKLFLQRNLTYYDILCTSKNEISFLFIVLYVANFLLHIPRTVVFTGDGKLPNTCTTH